MCGILKELANGIVYRCHREKSSKKFSIYGIATCKV